jgi:uncharacterized membrane protein
MNRAEAQRRADRIRVFREELARLEREGVLALPEAERARLRSHHDALLGRLAADFDVDLSDTQRQMSWGMRIASLLGAIALCSAVYFLFFRIWGLLSTPAQVAVLLAAPLAALAVTEIAARREPTLYFATLAALVACGCFVLDLSVLGMIFNIRPTQNAFLAWGAFALALAYAYGLRLILVAGIVSLAGYLSATVGTWSGCYWLSLGERPENFLLGGLLLFAAPAAVPHRRCHDFPPLYRLFGLLSVFIPVLVLSSWGGGSYLLFSDSAVEALYQVAGFAAAGGAIALGIRRGWNEVTNTGSTFFVIFLYTKFFDWWWEWMPKYLFFLVLALASVLVLLVLRRLRAFLRTGPA